MERRSSVNNTKNDFIIAFWKLYEKQPLEKISVSELCRIAGYNRTTFYVYYDNIVDLLDKAVDRILAPLTANLDRLSALGIDRNYILLERIYLELLKANREYASILLDRHRLYVLEDKIKEMFGPLLRKSYADGKRDEAAINYIIEYRISAPFGVIARWLRHRDMEDEEMIHLLFKIASQGVRGMTDTIQGNEEEDIHAEEDKVLNDIITAIRKQKEW